MQLVPLGAAIGLAAGVLAALAIAASLRAPMDVSSVHTLSGRSELAQTRHATGLILLSQAAGVAALAFVALVLYVLLDAAHQRSAIPELACLVGGVAMGLGAFVLFLDWRRFDRGVAAGGDPAPLRAQAVRTLHVAYPLAVVGFVVLALAIFLPA